MLSDDRVRKLLDEFVLLKADPRDPDVDRSLFTRYKATRYVPEVVFLDPQGDVVGRLESRDVSRVVSELRSVLDRVKSPSS